MASRSRVKPPGSKRLAEQIRERIHVEEYEEGDLFMTETQVAEEFGASRNITREAVSRLRALGILDSRKRKGLIVLRPSPVELFSQGLPLLARSAEDVRELATLRYVLEVGAIELAVANGSDEQIARLAELAQEFAEVVRGGSGVARENEVDLAFHGLILEMTGSQMVAEMQAVLARFFQIAYAENAWAAREADVWEHDQLATAIRDRDVERARAMLRTHFRIFMQFPSTVRTKD